MSNVLARFAFDNNLRTEEIIHLATMCSTDPMADAAEEAFNDCWDQIMQALKLDIPRETDLSELGSLLMQENLYGFLVSIGTPVPITFNDDGSYINGGFGHYATKWFYADNMADIFAQAVQWKTAYINQKREQALRKENRNG